MNQGPTVFVVDDEPTVLKAFLRLLRIAGYKAEGFGCGREFIEQYDAATGGCLVLDLSLSETTALEVQEWMARMGNPLPIIFLTGQDIIPSRVLSTKEGVVDILIKPVISDDFIKAIDRALAWNHARLPPLAES
jgi:FixJ family two-component response regulator